MSITADDAVKADEGGAVAEEFKEEGLERAFDFFVGCDAFHAFIVSRKFGKSIYLWLKILTNPQ